jgi:hypothetical protein
MIIFFKGFTAYELQIGKAWVRVCHLRGRYWAWKPWRRFTWGIDK